MAEPILSVTVTNYNYGRFLDRTITSILGQTFHDFELILIDNASTDDSLEVMHRFAAIDDRIRVVAHAQNEGMFFSLHESCDLSRGRYRVPIEADDWVLAPDAFEVQVDMLERNPSMAFVYSAMTMVGNEGQVFHVSHPYDGDRVLAGEDAVEEILSFSLTHTGMMMRVDMLRATLGYPEEYPHIADMLLGVRLCELGDVGYIDRELYAFRQHQTNLHLSPQRDMVKTEVIPVIDTAFAGPLAKRMADPDAVRRRVVRRALLHLPTQYIFSGSPAVGWRLYWESVKLRPADTILQPATLSLLARTVGGERGYGWLVGRLRPSSNGHHHEND